MLSFAFRIFCSALFFILISCSNGGSEPSANIVTGTAYSNSQSFATTRDTTLSITLNGIDDGNSYIFEILGQPNNGILTGRMLGSSLDLSYTPNNGYVGVDSFDFVVTDQRGNSATGTVVITILDSVDPSVDTDGDGLADLLEINQYRTNPNMADSDGDSLSDWREIIDLGFNPINDNYRYNPLIADVPKLRLKMTSAPNIFLNYETIDGSSKTISTERTQSSSSTISSSTTDSRSSTTEASLTIGAELTAKAGTETGVEKTVSFSASFSVSNETSHSYTEEQSTENSQAFSDGQSFEQNNAISTSSGGMQISLRIINDSSVPFTLKSLTLSAIDVDSSGNVVGTIGNLIFDNALAAFPEFTLGVKESSGVIIFSTADLDLSTANGLLTNSDGLIVGMATSEIVKSDGTPFAFDQIDLLSKTATIVIDYGPSKDSERYQVSVVGDPSTLSLSASDALQNILKIPYVADANNLLQLRDVVAPATDPDTYWMAVHVTGTSFGSTTTVYNTDGINPNELGSSRYEVMNDLAMRNLLLAPSDFLHLVYIKDADHDGLGERAEFFNGTNPLLADTDLDGLNDKQEVDGWDVMLSSVGEMKYNTVGYGKVEFWPASPHSGYRAFDGDIDEVRLWDVVRTKAQISAGKDFAATAPQTGLIGYWPMDEIITDGIASSVWSNTNAIQVDASGNGNHMYLRNVDIAAVVVNDGDYDIGMSFSLDGVDDNLTLPARLISSQRNMTLEMRFKTLTNGLLFAYQNPRGNFYTPALYVGSDGYLRGEFWMGTSNSVMKSLATVNDGLWHHVAISYDDSTEIQKLYLDGEPQAFLAGVMDHLGTSVNYHVSSDPLTLDADGDGLDDLAEFNVGTDPSKADTDGDYIQDAVDLDPTLREDTDISMAGTTPVITDNENTTISWVIPVLPTSISDYKVLILEQVIDLAVAGSRKKTLASLPADNVLPAINDKLECVDNTQCWTVVFSDATNPINSSGNMAPIAIPADNKVHEFMALIRVNGRWYLSDNTHTAYTGITDRITINFVAVDNIKCYDHTDDYLCERAWQMHVDGAAVLVRPDAQWIRAGSNVALTNGLNQAASTFSFDKPATWGSCLELKTRLSEIDSSNVYVRYEIHSLCYDDGWGTADSSNTVSDTLGTVSSVAATAGTTAGQAGFQGTYVYQTPESYIYGDLARFNAGKTVVSAKGRYTITVAPAP